MPEGFGNFILKVVVGIIMFPLAISMIYIWGWWEKAGFFGKVVSAPIVLPLAGILWMTSDWYNDLTLS